MDAGSLAAVLALAIGLAAAPGAALAGTYEVYSCTIDGGSFGNNAWVPLNNPGGDGRYVTDGACPTPGDAIANRLAPAPGGSAFGRGTFAGLIFTAPTGAYISDYRMLIHHYWYTPGATLGGAKQPDETTYSAVAVAATGEPGKLISGAGEWDPREREALAREGHWYGYRAPDSSGSTDTGLITVTRSGSDAAKSVPRTTAISTSVGCWAADPPRPACSLANDSPTGPAATVLIELYGSRITLSDDSNPDLSGLAPGQGLRASGVRSGSEAVTFSASDNVGIRRAELVDVTDAANPSIVAAKDYNSGTLTAQKTHCDFTFALPCPNLKNEILAAVRPIAGHRTLLVRVTDAAGNAA